MKPPAPRLHALGDANGNDHVDEYVVLDDTRSDNDTVQASKTVIDCADQEEEMEVQEKDFVRRRRRRRCQTDPPRSIAVCNRVPTAATATTTTATTKAIG